MSSLFRYHKPEKPLPKNKNRDVNRIVSDRLRGIVDATKVKDPVARFDALLEAFRALDAPKLPKAPLN